jgi:hypothetical protein
VQVEGVAQPGDIPVVAPRHIDPQQLLLPHVFDGSAIEVHRPVLAAGVVQDGLQRFGRLLL